MTEVNGHTQADPSHVQAAAANGHVQRVPMAPLTEPPLTGEILPAQHPRRKDGLPVGRPFQKGGDDRRPAGPGRPPGSINRPTKEVRDLARKFLEKPEYKRALARRLREGTAPVIEALLYHYAYGKPVDRVRIQGTFSGHVDLVAALESAWGKMRGADPRAVPVPPQALTNGGGT